MSHGSTIRAVSNSFSSAQQSKSARKSHGRLSAHLIHHYKSTMWTTSLHTQRLWICWLMGQDLTHTPSQAPGNVRYDCCPPKIHFHCEACEVNFLTLCGEKITCFLPCSCLHWDKEAKVSAWWLVLQYAGYFSSIWAASCCSDSCKAIGKIWFPLAETVVAVPLFGEIAHSAMH